MREAQSGSNTAEETSPLVNGQTLVVNLPLGSISQYNSRLAQVNGVVIPSRRAINEAPLQPSGTQSTSSRACCPVCQARYPKRKDIRAHFVACVGRNGNPQGARWNNTSRARPQAGRPVPSERMRITKDKLDAVNGVISASKLGPGQSPQAHTSQAKSGDPLNFTCPLCLGPFGTKAHVKSHFPACVGRNGNPMGLSWDDGM